MVARFGAGPFQPVRPPRFRERIAHHRCILGYYRESSCAAALRHGGRMKREISEIQRLNERLIHQAEQARERAKKLPSGPERDALLKNARRAEITDRWHSSSKLQPSR